MDIKNIKNRQRYIPRALLAFSGLLALLIGAKVSAFVMTSRQIPVNIEKTLNSPGRNEENIKKYQSRYTEATAALKKKNLFMPPAPPKKNPVTRVTAIFGSEALIKNKWYKVGDKIQDAEITVITPSQVTVVWNKKETKLQPFDSMAEAAAPPAASSDKKVKKSKPDKKTKKKEKPQPKQMEQLNEIRQPMPSGEERRKRIQEYMKNMTPEQRAKFAERRKSRRSSEGGRTRGQGSGRMER